MKSIEYIKNLFRRLDVESSIERRERTLADMVTAHVRHKRGPSGIRASVAGYGLRAAVAAAIALSVLIGILILHESATPAYAVEQTVAAIKKIPIVHILGRDWDDKQVEMWIKVNPDTGLMDSCHLRWPDDGRFIVSTPSNTYDYDGKANTVRIKDGPSVTSVFCLGDFFQGMERLAQTLDGHITYSKVTDPGMERTMLELKFSAPATEIVCLIDPQSKLPISINVTRGGRFNSCDILKHATEIRYGDTPPEGLLDPTIPAGADVSKETSEDPLRNLPVAVLRYCGRFHVKTEQEQARPQDIPVNTRMYFVDSEFNLHDGAFVGIYNDSNEVWKGEIGVFNVDPPHMAMFDATTGKKQQIRLVQHRQSPPGRFRVYWQFEEPLPPGETHYGIYWLSDTRKLRSTPEGSSHSLVMNNRFGGEAIENFMLIVPKGMEVHDWSRPYELDADAGDYRVYAWQRRLPAEMIVNQVDVALSRPSVGWLDSDAWMIVGPFDNSGQAGFETPYPPEKEIDFSKEYAGKDGPVKWFKPKRTRLDGYVDLAGLVGRRDWAVVYAAASVLSPETREMELRVGSDDDVKAWLNGDLVLSHQADRAAAPDQNTVPVTLRKGENQLLLKICNRQYSWGFYARIVDPNTPRYGSLGPPVEIARQEAADDLDFLFARLKAMHPKPFAKTPEETFRSEIERIKSGLPERVPTEDLSLHAARLLAMVGDDHTTHRRVAAFYEHVNNGGKVFPIRFRYQNNRMTVEAWSPEISPAHIKAGDTVTAVNGQTMDTLIEKYGRYLSLETPLQRCWAMEWWFEKYLVVLGDARDEYVLQLQDAEGQTYSETLPAVKPWLQAYVDAKSKSPRFHHQFYEDGKVCLLKLQTFNWDLRGELETKVNALIDAMKQNKTEIAILDVRGNGGGNSVMGDIVLRRMIDKPYGELQPDSEHSWPVKIVMLCDRSTYSAASFEAMLVKDLRIGIIAGEETGGRASFFGDREDVTLPNSHLVCGIATRYFQRRAGYDDGRGVLPDQPLDVTLDDGVLVEKIHTHLRQPVAVREWDLQENATPFTLLLDDPNDPNLVELRTKYRLEDLVRGAADDYEKLRRVLAWVQGQWEHNGNNTPSKSDPLTILKEVSQGTRFRCVEYAIVVAGCTRSLGMPSRTLGLMRGDVETAESGAGHVVAEVWLGQFNKWAMVDGQWGAIAESQGVPLNAVEFQDAIARKDSDLTIRFVSYSTTAERQASYIEWITPYLYYFNFGRDQRLYRNAGQEQPLHRRSPIVLVPKGARKPMAFQRHPAFQDATYISNPEAFYPLMDAAAATQSHRSGADLKTTLEGT